MASERDRKIRERAYELWEQGGRQDGSSEAHWHQAVTEFAGGSEGGGTEVETRKARKSTAGKGAKPDAPASGDKAVNGRRAGKSRKE